MTQEGSIETHQLEVLAKLPLLLNSSLDSRRVIERALDEAKRAVRAEAATIFLLDDTAGTLGFWALRGGTSGDLEGKKIPADKGIAGWVVAHREGVNIEDVKRDPRFFGEVAGGGSFQTRSMICVPLFVRGTTAMGALQLINREGNQFFSEADYRFAEQCAHQVALAIDNAKLYESLAEGKRQLELLDKRKTEMLSLIAHEFKTPLNIVLASADILATADDIAPSIRKSSRATLANGVKRINRLLSQLQEMQYIATGNLPLNRERVSVDALFASLQVFFKEALETRKVALQFEPAHPGLQVDADASQLFIVLRNLVANSIRFTPDDGVIRVRALEENRLIHFEVEDTGIGIADDQRELIFQKFYEVGNILEHHSGAYEFKSAGLGLGLATVKAILDAHGSTIIVRSVPGQGSCFSFVLPSKEEHARRI